MTNLQTFAPNLWGAEWLHAVQRNDMTHWENAWLVDFRDHGSKDALDRVNAELTFRAVVCGEYGC